MRNVPCYFFLLLLLTFLCTSGRAQTTLQPGDIGFILMNMDGTNTDAFGLVLLTDVSPNTSVVITDDEYDTNLTSGEGRVRINFTNAFSCGTQILFQDIDPDAVTYTYQATVNGSTAGISTVNEAATFLSLSGSGDCLILFQDANANTSNPANFVAVISNSPNGFGTGGSSSSQTAIPPGLAVGSSAVDVRNLAIPDEYDNVRFKCVNTSGTPANLKNVLFNRNNWEGQDSGNYPVQNCSSGFTCLAACQDPVLNGITVSPVNGCPGSSRTIAINGSLNDANQWVLREGGCTGTVLATTNSNSFIVSPTANTTYAVTVLDCNSQPLCRTATANISAPAANAGGDQILIPGTSTTLAANNPSPSSGQWTVVSGDGNGSFTNASQFNSGFNGTAGQAYLLRWTITGGGCPATNDEMEVSFSSPTTNLTAGDLAITGYNSVDNNPTTNFEDEFSFVILEEINAGTEINFTDRGWLATGGFRAGEGVLELDFVRYYPCSTEFVASRNFDAAGSWSVFDPQGRFAAFGASSQGIINLAATGDQLFAFTGSAGSPNLLAGLQMNGDWDADAADSGDSAQPPALTGNNSSLAISPLRENAEYNCAVSSGVPSSLRTAINNPSNWNSRDDVAYDLFVRCNFNCEDCVAPTLASVTASPNTVCPGVSTTVTINGQLNGANRWALYAGSCGGTEVATTTSGTLTFVPVRGTSYFVGGVDGCVATPSCLPLNISVNGVVADITLDKPTAKVNGTSVTLTATALAQGQSGSWSILSGSDANGSIANNGTPTATLSGTAGHSYELQYTVTGNGCALTTDETFVSFLTSGDLTLGDFMITGYNSDPTDNFSVVVLKDFVPAGQSFSATDDGWLAGGGFRGVETTINYLTCRPLYCGDEVRFEPDGNGYSTDGTIVASQESGAFPNLTFIGDQLFLYSGFIEPTAGANQDKFITAIQMNCDGCSEANWDGNATDSGNSAKPAPFQSNDVSIYGGGSPLSNARFDCTTGIGATQASIIAALTDETNWLFRNTPAYDLSQTCGSFSCCPVTALCQDITVEMDANGNPTVNGAPFQPADLDNGSTDCNGTAITDFSVDITPACDNIIANYSAFSSTTITLTATDANGATGTCTSQVTVVDNIGTEVTCNNISLELDAGGNTQVVNAGFLIANILATFSDNCAAGPGANVGGTQFQWSCTDLGNNTELYGFNDGYKPFPGNEDTCTPIVQINDPNGHCNGAITANCQDFTIGPDANGNYLLNANQLDNGSTADRGVYTLAFSDATDRQESTDQTCPFIGTGLGQSFTAGQTGVVQAIWVRSFSSLTTNLHLYAGNNGSGMPGQVGTPAYSQGVTLFKGASGLGMTRMLLNTPFPVVQGQEYTFVLEGETNIAYACSGDAYTGGRTMLNYVQWTGGVTEDYTFRVDIIGPITQEFTMDGTYPLDVYAVDNQGTISAVCNATFTLDKSLPVEWLSFGAAAGAKSVKLHWETSFENDNAGFHVERSSSGREWSMLAEVAPKEGHQAYGYTDLTPLSGTSFYRIRQTDLDGSITYSRVADVVFRNQVDLLAYPNPVSDLLHVVTPPGARLELFDLYGRHLDLVPQLSAGGYTLSLKQLPPATYLLRAHLEDGSVVNKKIVRR